TSSHPAIIANPTVNYTTGNSTGTLTYTPLPNANGSVTITVTLKDTGGTANGGIDTTTRTFVVDVQPINDFPTLDSIADAAAILEDAGAQTINLSGIGTGGEIQALTVTAVSSN